MLVASTMLPLGTIAPAFSLPDWKDQGCMKAWQDLALDQIAVVIFLCNHCPYVQHILSGINACIQDFPDVAWIAINANDVEAYPSDAPDKMANLPLDCPYLYDASQSVAKAYQAACTPDFYLFDQERRCIYRGRFDSATPGSDAPVTGGDLRSALSAALNGEVLPEDQQKPSMGCSIKWKNQ
jgi:hypothetical protein